MKKLLALILATVICLSLVLVSGCGNVENTTAPTTTVAKPVETTTAETTTTAQTTSAPTTTTEAPETTTAPPPVCAHSYEETVITPPDYLKAGEKELVCSLCGDKQTAEIPAITSIKILAIGNSFSEDAMEYLWDICKDAGFEEVILGNLFIGGCSLDTHWENIKRDKDVYIYYRNDSGKRKNVNSSGRVSEALADEDWDFITVQQVSQNSGMAETFGNLKNIVDYVEENKTNPDAKIYWHMTWAYQANSTHSGFANYKKKQSTMYEKIVEATTETAMKVEGIDGVIATGTTVQNLRSSYIGDALTRDGYHMSLDIGRYAVGLTWFHVLTGLPIDNIDYIPAGYFMSIAPHIPVIKEAVTKAAATPYAVTECTEAQISVKIPTVAMTDADKERLTKAGKNPDQYEVLDLMMTRPGFYNSSNGTGLTTDVYSSSNVVQFAASAMFQKEHLPEGTVICVDAGYQYRPEGWATLSSTNASRPGNETKAVVTVNAAWWGQYTIRAFNLSRVDGKDLTDADLEHFKVYIPKA